MKILTKINNNDNSEEYMDILVEEIMNYHKDMINYQSIR